MQLAASLCFKITEVGSKKEKWRIEDERYTRWYLEDERAKGWKTRFNEKLIRRKPILHEDGKD